MISTEKLLYRIDQELNKLSSHEHQEIAPEDKIIAINSAVITLVKQKVGLNNAYQMGLDSFKKRYEDLENLIVPFKDGKISLKVSDKKLNRYTGEVPDNMLFQIDSYLLGTKGTCKDVTLYTNSRVLKHGDISKMLNNETYKPSFEWREVPFELSSDTISFYTDGTFTLSNAYLSYIRYPQEADIEGYIHFDGTESTTVDLDLEDYLEDELLSLVVMNLALNTENNSAFQSAQVKGKISE